MKYLVIVILVLSMITAGLGNRVLAVEGSNTDDNSNSGNSDSNSNDNTNRGTSKASGEIGKAEQKAIDENNPTPTTDTNQNPDVKPDTPTNPPDVGICVIGVKSPCNGTDQPPVKSGFTDGGPDNDCLFHPELPKCKSDNGVCPDGFNQNEDGNCFPQHQRCPKGFHSHEDDETGRCIPNSVPCEPGYIKDPDFPTCSQKRVVCEHHPELKVCGGKGNDNHVIIIHKTKTIHKSDISNVATVFVKGVGLVEPFNCILNKNTGKIGCEFLIIKVIH